MSNESLIAIIVLLIGAHYGSLIYRLNKAEGKLDAMTEKLATQAINAAVAAANAVAAAAAALAAARSK